MRYYANNTGPLLSISGLYKWTDCQEKAWRERNGERQTESGMRLSKNIHRKLPQAESWREPSLECHHSATPAGLMLNTLQNKQKNKALTPFPI